MSSWGCRNQGPQAGWLQMTGMCCLPVLKANVWTLLLAGLSSLRSGQSPPCLFLAPAQSLVPMALTASLQSLPLSSLGHLPVCLPPNFPLSERTPVILD